MAFVISPKLAAIFIIVLPVLAVLIVVIMRRAFPQFRTLQEKLDALNSCIQEGLVGIRLIKSFVRGDYEEMRFAKKKSAIKRSQSDGNENDAFVYTADDTGTEYYNRGGCLVGW